MVRERQLVVGATLFGEILLPHGETHPGLARTTRFLKKREDLGPAIRSSSPLRRPTEIKVRATSPTTRDIAVTDEDAVHRALQIRSQAFFLLLSSFDRFG